MTYELIKSNYDKKLWNKRMARVAVKKGVIMQEQYKLITAEEYWVVN